jgi:heat shock protein HslJ
MVNRRLAIGVVLLAGACRSADGTAPSEPGPPDLAGTRWKLTAFGTSDGSGTDTPPVGGSEVTLELGTDGQASGSGGCNSYRGPYQAGGEALSFGPILSTKRACLDDAATRQETRYLDALQKAVRFARTGDRLTVFYDGGRGVLRFVRVPAGP